MQELESSTPSIPDYRIKARERAKAIALITEAMQILWGDRLKEEGMIDTPERVIKHWIDATKGLHQSPELHLGKTFACDYDEIVLIKDIDFVSLCEHHLLPFYGVAHIGYIPQGRVVGLSKIPRCLDVIAARPQMQERVTHQMADIIHRTLQPKGTIVVVEATHSCMSCRGVGKQSSKTLTSAVRGLFKEDGAARGEVFAMIGK